MKHQIREITWPQNSAPTYLSNMIAKEKNTSGNWWNWYNSETEILSSHWMEISRGVFHVISPTPSGVNTAFSVVLPYEVSHYDSLGIPGGELKINEDIWKSIRAQGLTDWRSFDRWEYNSSDGYFYFKDLGEGDGYVDMIYKIHKSRSAVMYPATGYNCLSGHAQADSFVVDDTNNIVIKYETGFEGSGITVSFRGQLAQYIGTVGHEHGHQLFSPGGHSTYSRVSRAIGLDNFSPADMILNRYMLPTDVTFNTTNNLGDYSSRTTGNGNLLKVPVQGNEFFLLANRNKISKWDRVMLGDSAQIDSYEDDSQNGKGLYIYHIPNGINFASGDISQQDMECADGLFEWEYAGQSAQQVIHDCFISGSTVWPYYKKKKVIYENDSSNLFIYAPPSGYTSRPVGDGLSLRYYKGIINNSYVYDYKWWSEGEKPNNSCNIGTDRLFTNEKEIYTRFDIGGDREDPWKPGYNEVFSPYSSPNTNKWSNDSTGIFIWYYDELSSLPFTAYLKIYKVGEGGLSRDSILHLTPPSRPMGLRIMPCDSLPVIDYEKRLKIRWEHNMEPDMRRLPSGISGYTKKYRIYRSTAEDLDHTPPDALQYSENYYDLIDSVLIDEYEMPGYVDVSQISKCDGMIQNCPPDCPYPVRYRVQAVDKYEFRSVLSDFDNTIVYSFEGIEGRTFSENENSPMEYSLKQNYPNPFNPSTTIKYELPIDGNVSIKIYDITGRIVKTLVNEPKTSGKYEVAFDGKDFASGIYYYKIESGNFSQVRKMILIK